MTPSSIYRCFVGIDIGTTTFVSTWAEADRTPTHPTTFNQTDAGFTAFQAQLPD